MITNVAVENFMRIDQPIRFGLGPVTVLVGENGSGKSSILKAIHWAVRCATLSDGGKVTLEQMDFVPSKDFVELAHKTKLQNAAAARKISVTLSDGADSDTIIRISSARNEAGVLVDVRGPMKTVLTAKDKPSTAYIPGIAGTAEEETVLVLPVMHRRASSGDGGSALRQIVLATANTTEDGYVELKELSKWVSLVLPGTKFWVKFDRLRDRNIHVRFWTPDMKIVGQNERVAWKSIEMAGTGFLQVVQIFSYFLYFKPRLLLIDEPDAHLHPGRQERLIRALEKAAAEFPNTQIILTTHSAHLVRALSKKASIHWIEAGAVRESSSVVRERMGWSALDKDLILFSEDKNSSYLQTLLEQWPELAHRCLIWPTFGKDGLPSGSRCQFFSKRFGIKVMVHRDRDFMSEADVQEWKEKKEYVAKTIPVWITGGADIESAFCTATHLQNTLGIEDDVVQEIMAGALASLDEGACMAEFSGAYSDVTNKLQNTPERNPIARWQVLGGCGIGTIKGKTLLSAIRRSCLSVLASRGLGTRIKRLENLTSGSPVNPLAIELKDALELALN